MLDKTEWADGPWKDEPDYLEFEAMGLMCKIRRGGLGHLCGYVRLPEDHPWADSNYMELPVDVHGGLTYGERESDGFYLGFDCAHASDLLPNATYLRSRDSECTYRDLAFVKNEIDLLAAQLVGVTHA